MLAIKYYADPLILLRYPILFTAFDGPNKLVS